MKKKDSIHKRTKEFLLRKPRGPSTPLPASSDAVDSDVPPAEQCHSGRYIPPVSDGKSFLGKEFKMAVDFDAEAEHLRSKLKDAGLLERFENPIIEDYFQKLEPYPHGMGNTVAFLPVEDSTSINQQARQVISKVPTSKPDSELARLEKSQLKGKKAQPKGGSES